MGVGTEHLYKLTQELEKNFGMNKILYLDIQKAYDNVPLRLLW